MPCNEFDDVGIKLEHSSSSHSGSYCVALRCVTLSYHFLAIGNSNALGLSSDRQEVPGLFWITLAGSAAFSLILFRAFMGGQWLQGSRGCSDVFGASSRGVVKAKRALPRA